jgi:hypothetical protein
MTSSASGIGIDNAEADESPNPPIATQLITPHIDVVAGARIFTAPDISRRAMPWRHPP